MTTTSPIKKAPVYENDALYLNKAFKTEGKFTGVSVDTPTFNMIKLASKGNGVKTTELEGDQVRLASGEFVTIFKFSVKGKRLNVVTRQMKLDPTQQFRNTYCFVKNEDVPTFMKNDDMEELENVLDGLDA